MFTHDSRAYKRLLRVDVPRAGDYTRGVGGVWRSLEAHRVWDAGVPGSNPGTPTGKRASPSGKASAFQADIRRFESGRPLRFTGL